MNDHFSKWREYFSSHLVILIVIFLGIILIALGFYFLYQSSWEEDSVEIIPAAQETSTTTILADIEGEIVKPGVYELPFGSRINDLLIMAGGLSAKADRQWVETNLNKAQKLKDGDKVYIPQVSETSYGVVSGSSTISVSSKININSATLVELDTLWGVGQITAQKIVDNRPYQKIEDLVSKKVLSQSTFQKISSQLSVY